MPNEFDTFAPGSLGPDTPEQNSLNQMQAAEEHDARVAAEYEENIREKRVSGLAALGMGTVAAATSRYSPIYLGTVGSLAAIDKAYEYSGQWWKGIHLVDELLGRNGMGAPAQQSLNEQAKHTANLGLAQTGAKWLDEIHEKTNDTLNVKPGILNKALYYGGWLSGEVQSYKFIGETLRAEKLASTLTPKAGGYAEAKLTNLFGKVVSEDLAQKTAAALIKAISRGGAYGTGYTAAEVGSDIVSGRKDKTLPEYYHAWLSSTMAIAGLEMAPWGLGVALPAAFKGGKKLWDAFKVNLMNPSEASVAANEYFSTASRTNVNNGAPYVKAVVRENVGKITPDVVKKLRWHQVDYTEQNAKLNERQYKIIDELGAMSKEDLHKASIKDLKEVAEIFKVLKDNSPQKYERWNKYDLENHINEALPDHGAYKSVGKVIEGEGWDLSATEQANYANTAKSLSSPIKELDYINGQHLSRPQALSKSRLALMKDRAEALRSYLKPTDEIPPTRTGVPVGQRLEGERYYNHPMAELLRELNQSEQGYRRNSRQISGLDAILNGDWEQRGQAFDDAITSHILSENTPPQHPSYEEQIRAKTSRAVQEETDTPKPDEGGAIEEARASDLSNLREADRQEFKDKFDNLERQEKNHPSYTKILDDTAACILKNMHGG